MEKFKAFQSKAAELVAKYPSASANVIIVLVAYAAVKITFGILFQ